LKILSAPSHRHFPDAEAIRMVRTAARERGLALLGTVAKDSLGRLLSSFSTFEPRCQGE
jgi:hypothetical protein